MGKERKWFPGTQSLRRKLPLFLLSHVDKKHLNVRLMEGDGEAIQESCHVGVWKLVSKDGSQ